jgi:cardiolipin synthase
LRAVKAAKRSIDIVIFRFDRTDLEKALEAAVARGVNVRALIAHTNSGGEKILRKLEARFLASGVTVSRTADDLPRYHGKMMVVDSTLYVFGFNYTKLDIEKSRSFGIVTSDARLVKEACALFEADNTRMRRCTTGWWSAPKPRVRSSPRSSREPGNSS